MTILMFAIQGSIIAVSIPGNTVLVMQREECSSKQLFTAFNECMC